MLEWVRASMTAGKQVLGIHGAQGIGKSTVCAHVAQRLTNEGVHAVVVSLDDLYLTRAERVRMAGEVHPLFATRGVPGTHDIALGLRVLHQLRSSAAGEVVMVPRFHKGTDDRQQPQRVVGPVDVVLFEGWCVGLPPLPVSRLDHPCNELERTEDPTGRWRRTVAAHLANAYPALWAQLDAVLALLAPSVDAVVKWRTEAERTNAHGPRSIRDVARFVAHFERCTTWALEVMPAVADRAIAIAEDRTPVLADDAQ